MRNWQFGFLPAGAVALALLTGCSSSNSGTSPMLPSSGGSGLQAVARRSARSSVPNVLAPFMQSAVHPSATTSTHIGMAGSCPSAPVGFISDVNYSVVYELDQSGTVCATLTGFTNPQGIATDAHGNLYVANTDASNILEVNASTGSVIKTYQDPGEYPVDVCVANSSGNLAVTNIYTPSRTPGNVTLYTAGSTSGPSGTAAASNYTSPRFCAYDRQNNAFAFDDYDQFNTYAVNVGAVIPGDYNGTKSIIPLSTPNTIAFPGGVEVNGSNQLVVGDQGKGNGGSLYTYTVSGTALTLASTTPMAGSLDPVGFAFEPGYHFVLTADGGLGAALVYAYPAGGSAVNAFTLPFGGLPLGAAIDPTAQFAFHHM